MQFRDKRFSTRVTSLFQRKRSRTSKTMFFLFEHTPSHDGGVSRLTTGRGTPCTFSQSSQSKGMDLSRVSKVIPTVHTHPRVSLSGLSDICILFAYERHRGKVKLVHDISPTWLTDILFTRPGETKSRNRLIADARTCPGVCGG